ncbi:MAG: Stp1/IreP family PP2C-type Ser/Thr phosphatase [Acidobacteriia bacterium]|nr:Stp1/IreP family PP2C-type Ser/Thr phosphatase [Terriglobia bacterium]
MQIRKGIDVAGLSDVGCQRQNNEDHYSYWEPANDAEFERKGRLAIVADGMGGHEGGQEASHIAVEAIQEVYAAMSGGDAQSALAAGFHEAHQRISRHALQHPELRGMGTTATAVVVLAKHLYYAHIGDSRLYLLRGGETARVTHDHSYVSRLVENGTITEEEAEVHPQRHVLTAALGVGLEVSPDAPENPVDLKSGDALVLCSDGLWGMLSEAEIREGVTNRGAEEACRALVALAKKRGGPDNITVLLLRVL